PKVEFREAFAYVHRHWRERDTLWVSHPEVYQVYFGRDASVLGCYTPPEQVERAASAGPLWVVSPPQDPMLCPHSELLARLRVAQSIPVQPHRLKGLDVVLYVPSTPKANAVSQARR